MKFYFAREVDCPQELAFAYFSDRDKDLEWWHGTIDTRLTSGSRANVGEVNHQVQRIPGVPLTFEIEIEVLEWDPPRRWLEVCRSTAMTYFTHYEVQKLDDERSRVMIYGELTFRGLLKALYPLSYVMLTKLSEANFDRLKQRLDALGGEARKKRLARVA